jgi:HEAT repeat protein
VRRLAFICLIIILLPAAYAQEEPPDEEFDLEPAEEPVDWKPGPAVLKAVPNIVELLNENSRPGMRTAIEALRKIKPEDANPLLFAILRHREKGMRRAIEALVENGGPEVVDFFLDCFLHEEFELKWESEHALVRLGEKSLAPLIKLLHETKDAKLRGKVTFMIACNSDKGLQVLLDALKEGRQPVRETALAVLVRCEENVVPVEMLLKLIEEKSPGIHRCAAALLARSKHKKATEYYLRVLEDEKQADCHAGAVKALGDTGDRSVVPVLIKALKHRDPLVRNAAASALGYIGDQRAVKPLIEAMDDPELRKMRRYPAASNAVSCFGKSATPQIAQAYRDAVPAVRLKLLSMFEHRWDEQAMPMFLNALKTGPPSEKVLAIKLLRRFKSKEITDALIGALKDGAGEVRAAAAGSLGEKDAPRAFGILKKALRDTDARMRSAAALTLGRIGGKEATDALTGALKLQDAVVRAAAARALGGINDKSVLSALFETVSDDDEHVRASALGALVETGHKDIVPMLVRALEDPSLEVRKEAVRGLEKHGDERAFGPLAEMLGQEDTVVTPKTLVKAGGKKALAYVTQMLRISEDTGLFDTFTDAGEEILRFGEDAVKPLRKASTSEDKNIKREALILLAHLRDEKTLLTLIDLMKSEDEEMRSFAIGLVSVYRDKRAVEPLLALLDDDGYQVAETAIESLGELGDRRAVKPLIKILLDCDDSDTFCVAADALVKIGDEAAIEPLILSLLDDSERIRYPAARCLGLLKDKRAADALFALTQDRDGYVMVEAVLALSKMNDKRAIKPLMYYGPYLPMPYSQHWTAYEHLRKFHTPETADYFVRLWRESGDFITREFAAAALGEIGGKRAVESLRECFKKDEIDSVRMAAAAALMRFGDKETETIVKEALTGKDADARRDALSALMESPDRKAIPWLRKALDSDVRITAANVLVKLGDHSPADMLIKEVKEGDAESCYPAVALLADLKEERAIEPLIDLLEKGRDFDYIYKRDIRYDALEALEKISGQNFGWNYQRWRRWHKERESKK